MRLFANPVFTLAMLASSLLTIGQYCRLIYIPLELGTTRGIDELKIGFVMLPAALGVAATMPLGGRLTDRIGARLPVALGAAVLFVSYLPLANLGPDTQLRWISLALLGGGLGAGLAVMSPNIVAMNAVPAPSVGQASGLSPGHPPGERGLRDRHPGLGVHLGVAGGIGRRSGCGLAGGRDPRLQHGLSRRARLHRARRGHGVVPSRPASGQGAPARARGGAGRAGEVRGLRRRQLGADPRALTPHDRRL
ncbi:MAG: MFS transporter [Ilumatobacteraceae bacterium]